MTLDNTLQIELVRLAREITNLKTAHSVSPMIRAYTMRKQISDFSNPVTITYADGNQPIISELFFDWGDAIGLTPTGNTQKVVVSSQVVGYLTVVSTRQILSIT